MNNYYISETEALKVLVKNVNDRPNALATYGDAKKTGTETKDIFDRQFHLVKEKHNALCKAVDDIDLEALQQRELLETMFKRLTALVDEIQSKLDNGEFKGEKGDPGESPALRLFETDEGILLKVINADGSEYEATLPDYLLENVTRAEDISV